MNSRVANLCGARSLATHILLLALGFGLCLTEQGRAQFADSQELFDSYLFGGVDETTFRQQLETKRALLLDRIVIAVGLQSAKAEKLKLAMKGDLGRFIRDLREIRDQASGLRIDNQQDMQQAWQMIRPLHKRLEAGIWSETSLFHRVLEASLTKQQLSDYRAYLRDRATAEFDAIVDITISDVERTIPFTSAQRLQLQELLRSQRYPKNVPAGYEPFVGFIILARTKHDALATILDEQQLKSIQSYQRQYEAYARSVTW